MILNEVKNLFQDTIVAPATLPGTGALSILRISGPDALKIADAVISINSGKISESEGYKVYYGGVKSPDGGCLDEVLVTVFKAPRSYTGEDSVEVTCHASSYIVSELIRLFIEAGARYAEPGEFTKRAFCNGKMDLAQAEAVADVISSSTLASHRIAMNQLRGGFSSELKAIRGELLNLASMMELELDFSEEEVEFANCRELQDLLDRSISRIDSLADSFHKGNALKNGIPIAIVGPPNSGKSTLLNSLLNEERAIVSPFAGTTRDTIEEVTNLGGLPFRFIDTAGIRETDESVEKLGIERSFSKISEAEIVLTVLDVTSEESVLLTQIKQVSSALDFGHQQMLILLNKTDLVGEMVVNKNVTIINNFVLSIDNNISVISICARDKSSVDSLKERLVQMNLKWMPTENSTSVSNARHYAALTQASGFLTSARSALTLGTPSDLVAEDLLMALDALGSITGEVTSTDLLNHIFSKHCIGK